MPLYNLLFAYVDIDKKNDENYSNLGSNWAIFVNDSFIKYIFME